MTAPVPAVPGESVDRRLAATPCPGCGVKALRIETRLHAKPPGTYSLAGAQLKVSAVEWPYLVCDACGISAPASPEVSP